MNSQGSCLYACTVMHHRLAPKPHRFHYRVFMFYVDLDEIDTLARRFAMFSRNRFNFFSFRDREHLQLPIDAPDTSQSTKAHLTRYLAEHGIDITGGRIMLLTNMNVLGYNFNPVSFYFCFDTHGEPLCCVAEVSNTFREMKPYLMNREQLSGRTFHLRTEKYFYVSPFIDHDTHFDFSLAIPADRLNIRIDDYKDKGRFFISTLTGTRKPLSSFNLLRYSLRFPFITLRIIALIHWHALRLWLKKLPYHKKSANMHLQKDVFRRYDK